MTGLSTGLDVRIYQVFNDFCGWSSKLDKLLLQGSALKCALLMCAFGFLWFRPDGDVSLRRELLITTILAVLISLILNRTLSTLLPFRERPIYSIGGHAPSMEWRTDLENWSSFPSDHAYLFAIAAGFWLISRPWGAVFGMAAAEVKGVPVNATAERPDPIEVARLFAVARIVMPLSVVRFSAGRQYMTDELQALCFLAGANSIFIGDVLLTTRNPQGDRDADLLDRLGIDSNLERAKQPTAARDSEIVARAD